MGKKSPIDAISSLSVGGQIELHGSNISIRIPRALAQEWAIQTLQDYTGSSKGALTEDDKGILSLDLEWPGDENSYLILADWEHLLLVKPRYGKGFSQYFIISEKLVLNNDQSDIESKRYIHAAKFIDCLYDLADYKGIDGDFDELTFINKSSTTVKIIASQKYLGNILNLEKFSLLTAKSNSQRDYFSPIAKNNISHFLSSVLPSARLDVLILRSNEFIDKCLAEHAIYCNEESFDKVLGAVRKECITFISELEKITSSLYIKSMILPASFVLLGREALEGGARAQIAVCGAALFTLCGVALTVSHIHSLRHLRKTVVDRILDLAMEYGVSTKEMEDRFKVIKARLENYLFYSYAICLFLVIFLGWFIAEVLIFT